MPINIIIANKRKLMREVLKNRFESDEEIRVVADTDDGYQCLSLANKLNPNIIISDLELNGLDGLSVMEVMHKQSIRSKFMILCDSFHLPLFSKAIDGGCDGYLTQAVDFTELKKAVFSIYNGEKYVQEEYRDVKELPEHDNELITDNVLTNREIEILKLIAIGESNKEIGERCNISERTVKNHIFNIYKKLSVNDRTQAAVYAIRNNIVDL